MAIPGQPGGGVDHATSHDDGGADEVTVEGLATAGANGTVPTSDGAGGLAMAAPAGGGALTFEGSDDAEQTSASTGDLNSVTGLTIATTKTIVVEYDFRKTSSSSAPRFGLKLNATELMDSGLGPTTTSTVEAQSGHAKFVIGPRDAAAYLGNGYVLYAAIGATAGAQGHNRFKNVQPSAQITSITATINGAATTAGIANLRVYSI